MTPIPLSLVDLRPQQEFDQRHLHLSHSNSVPTTTIVNLPLSQLLSGERSCELPPRHVEFAILIPSQYISSFLTKDSTCVIHSLFFANKSTSTLQSRKPWLVRQVVLEDDLFWENAQRLELLVHPGVGLDAKYYETTTEDTTLSFRKLPRLWKPDPLISSAVLPLLSERVKSFMTIDGFKCDDSNIRYNQQFNGVILDLGSGAGRDVCYLAEEMKELHSSLLFSRQNDRTASSPFLSLKFIGIDNHKGSAKRCIPLWKYRGVSELTRSVHLNLEKLEEVHDFFTTSIPSLSREHASDSIVCIYAIRYLNRKLFAYLADSTLSDASKEQISMDPTKVTKKAKTVSNPAYRNESTPSIHLPKGTILAISHFCKPHPSSSWKFDHPKESRVLDRYELRDLFQSVGSTGKSDEGSSWKIVKDDICLDGDHGRTLIQFVAVKLV